MKVALKIKKCHIEIVVFMCKGFTTVVNRNPAPGLMIHASLPTGITQIAMKSNINNVLIKIGSIRLKSEYKNKQDKTPLSLDINEFRDLYILNSLIETNTAEQIIFTHILEKALKSVA